LLSPPWAHPRYEGEIESRFTIVRFVEFQATQAGNMTFYQRGNPKNRCPNGQSVIPHDVCYCWFPPQLGTRPLDGTYHQPLLVEGYRVYEATNSMCRQTGEMVKGCLARLDVSANTFRQTVEWVHRSMHHTLVH